MSFDPYYLWLGVPSHLQPPHCYRLLGLSPFESDVEVIENASRLRAQFLTRQLSGPYAAQAESLLQELERATTTLLDDIARQHYDQQLLAEAARTGVPVPGFEKTKVTLNSPTQELSQSSSGAAEMPPQSAATSPPPRSNVSPPAEVGPSASSESPVMAEVWGAGDPSGTANAGGPSGFGVNTRSTPRYRRSNGRGWLVSLAVLLMFLPAHGVLLWIGYRIANYQENGAQAQAATGQTEGTNDTESNVRGAADGRATGINRWPQYGIVVAPGEAAVWQDAGRWFPWSKDWTLEVWMRTKSKREFQPVFGVYNPPPAGRSSSSDWSGWVLGYYQTPQDKPHLRLVTKRRGAREREMVRIAIPGKPSELTHLCLVADGNEATICWNGEPIGRVDQSKLSDSVESGHALWLGNSTRLPEPGQLNAEFLGIRLSSIARYAASFQASPSWRPDDHTQLLLNLESLRVNTPGRRSVIDVSRYSHRGELLGARWIKWDK